MKTLIHRVCQYCGADMGTKDGKGMTGTSHGVCKPCGKLSEPEQMAIYKARVARARVVKIIDSITLPADWRVELHQKGDGFLVQIVFFAKDTDTGDEAPQRCRKWYVSSHSTVTEVVRTIYKAGLAALEHEFAEAFKYKGAAVFHPHRSIELLVGNCAPKRDFDRRK